MVDDDNTRLQPITRLRQHVFDHGVILEHQMHALRSAHRILRRGCALGAKDLERTRLIG